MSECKEFKEKSRVLEETRKRSAILENCLKKYTLEAWKISLIDMYCFFIIYQIKNNYKNLIDKK